MTSSGRSLTRELELRADEERWNAVHRAIFLYTRFRRKLLGSRFWFELSVSEQNAWMEIARTTIDKEELK